MALNNMGFGLTFVASDLASSVIRKLTGHFLDLDKSVERASDNLAKRLGISADTVKNSFIGMSQGLAVATAGFAGLGTAFSLANQAAPFERSLIGFQAATNASTEDMKKLEAAAKQAALTTTFGAVEAAEALRMMGTSGFTAKESIEGLRSVLNLATASQGEIGLQGSVETIRNAVRSFSELGGDFEKAADIIVRGASRSGLSFRELPHALSNLGAQAQLTGAHLDDLMFILGTVRDAGQSAAMGSHAISHAMSLLTRPEFETRLLAQGVGIRDMLDPSKLRQPSEILGDLALRMEGLGKIQMARKLSFFDASSLQIIIPTLKKLTERANALGGGAVGMAKALAQGRKEMADTGITAQGFADKVAVGFTALQEATSEALDTMTTDFGEAFIQVLSPIFRTVRDAVRGLVEAFVAIPMPIKVTAAAMMTFGSAALVFTGVTAAGAALLPILTALFSSGGALAVVGTVGAAVVAGLGPIIGVVAGVTVAVGLLTAAWQTNFAGIRESVLPTLESLHLVLASVFDLVTEGKIGTPLAERLMGDKKAFDFVQTIAFVIGQGSALLGGYFQGISDAFSSVQDAFRPVFTEIGKFFTSIGELINPIVRLLGVDLGGGLAILQGIGYVLSSLFLKPLVMILSVWAFVTEKILQVGRALMWAQKVIWLIGGTIFDFMIAPLRGLVDWLFGPGSFSMAVEGLFDLLMFLGSAVKSAFESVVGFIGGLFSGIVNTILSGIDGVLELAASVAEAFGRTELAKTLRAGKFDLETDKRTDQKFSIPEAELVNPFGLGLAPTETAATMSVDEFDRRRLALAAGTGPVSAFRAVPASAAIPGSPLAAQGQPPAPNLMPGEIASLVEKLSPRVSQVQIILDGKVLAQTVIDHQKEAGYRAGDLAVPNRTRR